MVAELNDARAESDGTVRLRRSHVCLIDALLETDRARLVRRGLRGAAARAAQFVELKPARAPKAFVGTLRPYQSEGLAWLEFLGRVGFGGCLADDMGLGKTIQVLALLLARKKGARRGQSRNPSLIVVPRSLVHNWIDEARRFAPSLRLLSHVGQ